MTSFSGVATKFSPCAASTFLLLSCRMPRPVLCVFVFVSLPCDPLFRVKMFALEIIVSASSVSNKGKECVCSASGPCAHRVQSSAILHVCVLHCTIRALQENRGLLHCCRTRLASCTVRLHTLHLWASLFLQCLAKTDRSCAVLRPTALILYRITHHTLHVWGAWHLMYLTREKKTCAM